MNFRLFSRPIRGLLVAAFNTIIFAQSLPVTADSDIVTDRPDVTESSIVVPKGSLQIENGVTWTTDHRLQTFDGPESLMRFGLATRTEFRITVPNYFGAISGPDPTGLGDITLGMKEQLGPLPKGFDLSVIFAVSLPVGASGVSNRGYDPFIKLPWSKELKGGWSIGGMQSFFSNTDGEKRNAVWEPTFYIEREITKQWQAFAEYAGDFAQRRRAKGDRSLWHGVQVDWTPTVGFSLRLRRIPLSAEPFLCGRIFGPCRWTMEALACYRRNKPAKFL